MRQEEAFAMLDRIQLDEFRTDGDEDRTALRAIVSRIQSTALVPLPAARGSSDKLRFLRRAVYRTDSEIHMLFRLPGIHSYSNPEYSLFYALQTLTTQAASGVRSPLSTQTKFKTSN